MNDQNISLPPLPEWVDWPVTVSEMTASEIKEAMQAYAREAIEPYAKRIAELESQLEAIGAGGVTQGQRLIEADRQRRGEPVAWQWLDTAHFRKKIPSHSNAAEWRPLFTTPQPAEPVNMDLVRKWQAENAVEQRPDSREARMVVIRHDDDGKPTIWCDPEIADLVRALNDVALATVGSCSGHGWRPGNIMLADGRVLVVCKDADEAREIESHFPGINGEAPLAADMVTRMTGAARAAVKE